MPAVNPSRGVDTRRTARSSEDNVTPDEKPEVWQHNPKLDPLAVPTLWSVKSGSRAGLHHTVRVTPKQTGRLGFTCNCERSRGLEAATCSHWLKVANPLREMARHRAQKQDPPVPVVDPEDGDPFDPDSPAMLEQEAEDAQKNALLEVMKAWKTGTPSDWKLAVKSATAAARATDAAAKAKKTAGKPAN